MKICQNCGKEKDLSNFRKVGKYIRNICKQCENEESIKLSHATREYVDSLRTKCEICGYSKCKAALDFHHQSDDKEYNINHLRKRKWSANTKRLIDNEVEKCIVVCANCHRELHYSKD